MLLSASLGAFSGRAFSAEQLKCASKLKEDKNKNPHIYVLGELHEQDVQKHFIIPACEGKITLGIEYFDKDGVMDLYNIFCPFRNKIFGFEDEGLYAMFLLFRENVMLDQYYGNNDDALFRKAQNEVINLLWMSNELEAAWKMNRESITKKITDPEEIKTAGFIDKFLEFKNDKKFKRKVLMLKSFEKPWDKMAQGYGPWASMLEDKKAFTSIVRELSSSLGNYVNADGLGCYDTYIKDLSDKDLGLYCYFKILSAREKAAYRNILDNYCNSLEQDRSLPVVITVGAGHVPNISEMLERDMQGRVNIETIISKTASEFTIAAFGKSKNSITKELYPEYSEDPFIKGLYSELEDNINFLTGPDIKVLSDDKMSCSIVKGL
jgi:hypothetical protein